MPNITVEDLRKTSIELISNINNRIDSLFIEINENPNYDIKDRIIYLIDDLTVLSSGVEILDEEYSNIKLGEFKDVIFNIYESVNNNDIPLFIDLLKFELVPLLEHWQEML